MKHLKACPECRSPEIRQTERFIALHGLIRATVCGACDWSSDARVGRPAADRSKNVGLRRRMGAGPDATDASTPA